MQRNINTRQLPTARAATFAENSRFRSAKQRSDKFDRGDFLDLA
jgi:hypothetical protein